MFTFLRQYTPNSAHDPRRIRSYVNGPNYFNGPNVYAQNFYAREYANSVAKQNWILQNYMIYAQNPTIMNMQQQTATNAQSRWQKMTNGGRFPMSMPVQGNLNTFPMSPGRVQALQEQSVKARESAGYQPYQFVSINAGGSPSYPEYRDDGIGINPRRWTSERGRGAQSVIDGATPSPSGEGAIARRQRNRTTRRGAPIDTSTTAPSRDRTSSRDRTPDASDPLTAELKTAREKRDAAQKRLDGINTSNDKLSAERETKYKEMETRLSKMEADLKPDAGADVETLKRIVNAVKELKNEMTTFLADTAKATREYRRQFAIIGEEIAAAEKTMKDVEAKIASRRSEIDTAKTTPARPRRRRS